MENRIRERIIEAGVTQKDLAERLGMTTVGLNQLIRGTMPKVETFVKIAEALGVPAWSLLLSDEELDAIRATAPNKERPADEFLCPKCGAQLKVVPADGE